MKSIGEIYFDGSLFADEASKTMWSPAVGEDATTILNNRRNTTGKLNPSGNIIFTSLIDKIKNAFYGDEIKLKWNRYCGCSTCPCSPGFRVLTNRDVKSSNKYRFVIHVTEDGKIDLKEPSYLFEVGKDNFDRLKKLLKDI